MVDPADLYPQLGVERGPKVPVADIGYVCANCGCEWGYDWLTPGDLAAINGAAQERTRASR